ncbi:uracil-xanthine permease family protein [Roseomonas marmotae]|uniref:Purine/pyrimidine permease n=1 Tax=Roseomonas marmotae TaxID=2768161 RepID=A0ABS3KF07_9PROT|nr:solute carrier family 23 protein [Roseomonas marmotae]MBO1075587.1 purine/pyrimidine permease [Roseomonas marmotae]QTI79449.1 purine/pyrimidine permease [Roseomonas marmotae]
MRRGWAGPAGWLDRLFPRPVPGNRKRPEDFVYTTEEKPPLPVLLGMGLQHALLALIFALYAVIAAQGMGLDAGQTIGFVSATVLVMGCGTLLQSLPTRFSAGMLLVTIPGPSRLPIHIAVTLQFGLAATMGATIIAGLATVAMARLIPRLRPVFPPEVIGVVVLMLGITLVTGGVSRSVGLTGEGQAFSGPAALAAAATVACMVGIAVWGSPGWRRVAMLAGAVVGTLVAALTGSLPTGGLPEMPLLAVPVLGLQLPWPEFHPVAVLVILLSQFITIMDQFASTLSMDRLTDANWRRADMPMVGRAITGVGITQILFGCTGTLPGSSSSANIGLVHATGIAARRVGTVAGLALILAAFFPPVAGLLALTPAPVVGGILLYTAAYMITAGMDLIMSRMMNARRSFTVGLAVVLGTAVMLVPQLSQEAPEWSRVILASGLTVGAIAAVALNALFRIGIRQTHRQVLPPEREAQAAQEALEFSGKLWGVRQDTVLRAGYAVGEALEALREMGVGGPVTLTTSFDEFSLVSTLSYRGRALRLEPGAAPDMAAMLEAEEEDLDDAMRQLSALMIVRLADRVRASQRGETAELQLSISN